MGDDDDLGFRVPQLSSYMAPVMWHGEPQKPNLSWRDEHRIKAPSTIETMTAHVSEHQLSVISARLPSKARKAYVLCKSNARYTCLALGGKRVHNSQIKHDIPVLFCAYSLEYLQPPLILT